MTRKELRKNMREMVAYLLPEPDKRDDEAIDSYTDTMCAIAEQYANSKNENNYDIRRDK